MSIEFIGTAHPPANDVRKHPADLSTAEIVSTNLGHRGTNHATTPILVEHGGPPVGEVLTSYRGPTGSLRVLGTIHDKEAQKLVKNGQMLGLSLGTDVVHREGEEDEPVVRTVHELSICAVPRRPGCYISEVDGQRYHTAIDAASAAGVCRSVTEQ